MIFIRREGTRLRLQLDVFVPLAGRYTYELRFNTNAEDYAAFLVDAAQRQLENQLEQIRRDAYQAGWADHRTRRNKETFFAGNWSWRYKRR